MPLNSAPAADSFSNPAAFRTLFVVWLLTACTSSLPSIYRHLGSYQIAAAALYFVALSVFSWRLLSAPPESRILQRYVPFLLVVLLAVASIHFYAVSLLGRPSGGPIAVNFVTSRIFAGRDPSLILPGDPSNLSPGPGWCILNAFLVLPGGVMLVTPFWFLLATLSLYQRLPTSALPFVCLSLAQADVLQMSLVGHDILAICFAFVFITVEVFLLRSKPGWLVVLGVVAGLAATARLPMIIALVPITVGLRKASPGAAKVFGTVSLGTCLAVHAFFIAWAAHDHSMYQPTHLFHRASSIAGWWFSGFAALVALTFLLVLLRSLSPDPRSWLIANWAVLSAAFMPIGFGEALHTHPFLLAEWEGKAYVSFALSLLTAALVLWPRPDAKTRATRPVALQQTA